MVASYPETQISPKFSKPLKSKKTSQHKLALTRLEQAIISNFTSLQNHLRKVGQVDQVLAKQIFNGLPKGDNNNQVYEFRGDTNTNLAFTLAVKDAIATRPNAPSNPHFLEVTTRIFTMNNTLGRLSYVFRLHKHAEFQAKPKQSKVIDAWCLESIIDPPKVLADVLEAFIAALVDLKGWERVRGWLQYIVELLIDAAIEDFNTTPRFELISSRCNRRRSLKNRKLAREITNRIHSETWPAFPTPIPMEPVTIEFDDKNNILKSH